MNTYQFEISSDAVDTCEILEAVDDAAAVRQAVLLMSEILRDHALSSQANVALIIVVRGGAGRTIWRGRASSRIQRPRTGRVRNTVSKDQADRKSQP